MKMMELFLLEKPSKIPKSNHSQHCHYPVSTWLLNPSGNEELPGLDKSFHEFLMFIYLLSPLKRRIFGHKILRFHNFINLGISSHFFNMNSL